MSLQIIRFAGACAGVLLTSGCSSMSTYDKSAQQKYSFPYSQHSVAMVNVGSVQLLDLD
jgi:uncharacterized protein YceK